MPTESLRPPSPSAELAGATHRGLVRVSNQDAYVILDQGNVPSWCQAAVAVFDGVGGRYGGQEASSRAGRYLAKLLMAKHLPQSGGGPALLIADLILDLHTQLRVDQKGEPHLKQMATTATMALRTRAAPNALWIGHVGDSPALRVRDGCLEKLVVEDSLVAGLLKNRLITEEQSQGHPQRHIITQALGHNEEIEPHVSAHEVRTGDRYLLCTDGLTDMVSERQIIQIVSDEVPQRACRNLVSAANKAGGIDNITVVIMKF